MERLAKVFQAQHYASEDMVLELSRLAQENSWVINHPWTAQRWLPISQAAWVGHRRAVEALLEMGADLSLKVGASGEELTIADFTRQSGNGEIAELLERSR